MRRIESLAVLFKITELKDGCVWKTKELGEHWIPMGVIYGQSCEMAKSLGGDFFGPVSTSRMKELNYVTTRSVVVTDPCGKEQP